MFTKLHDLPGEPFELLVALLDANSPVYDFENKKNDKNKNSEERKLMRPQAYTTRRGATMGNWSRNQNTVRHTNKALGSISNFMIIMLLVLIVGLIYVSQGAQATNYDYEISAIEDEIAELEAKKEDLAVERARLTSIAASESSTVASSMEDANVEGYAE